MKELMLKYYLSECQWACFAMNMALFVDMALNLQRSLTHSLSNDIQFMKEDIAFPEYMRTTS